MPVTIITNDNIKELIHNYLTDKNKLPNDLKNVPIGDWNVSEVTDMSHLFHNNNEAYVNFDESIDNWNLSNVTNTSFMLGGCVRFNRPLNNLDVSNVTILRGMFYNCENFNQPLDNWNTSSAEDMESMFVNCLRFNQSLRNWDVSNVTVFHGIFYNCGISEANKPHFINDNTPEVYVDAQQIHRESAKINYEKLNTFLENILNITVPPNMYFPDFIYNTLASFIDESNFTEEEKEEKIDGLERIMEERLGYLNYDDFPIQLRDSIFYVLEYVDRQPIEFKEMYVNTFIKDCVQAYEVDGENNDGMTCAAGALERIVMSLVPACVMDENNENYKRLIDIIIANPSVLIPEYIKDWYKLHKTGTPGAFPPGTTEEEKKNDLKNYLLEKFPEYSTLIDAKIMEISDNIGYEDDDFMYGGKKGRKRGTKKYIKRKNIIGKKIKSTIKKQKQKQKQKQKREKTKNKKNILKNKTKKRKNEKIKYK